MINVTIHTRTPIRAVIGRRGGAEWITIHTDQGDVTFFGRNTSPTGTPTDTDPTLSELAEALAQPMIEIQCDEQAAEHDHEEAARLAAGGSPIRCDLSDAFGLDTPAEDVSNGLPIRDDATTA